MERPTVENKIAEGYPKVFKNPMWFIVHQDLINLLLKGLPGEDNSNKKHY